MSASPRSPQSHRPEDDALMCEVTPERDVVRVRAFGTLDLATGPQLEQQLSELRAAGFDRLILDLRGLGFMDSTGLRLVLRWAEAARGDGFEMRFTAGSPEVQRVFDVAGVLDRIPFVEPPSG